MQYLQDTGQAVVFEQPGLGTAALAIFAPDALAQMFAEIVSFTQGFVRDGLLRRADLWSHVWKSRTEDEKQLCANLLLQFGVIFRQDQNTYVVPSLLPPSPQDYEVTFNKLSQTSWAAAGSESQLVIRRHFSLPCQVPSFFSLLHSRFAHSGLYCSPKAFRLCCSGATASCSSSPPATSSSRAPPPAPR
jgi:hypothetical protein